MRFSGTRWSTLAAALLVLSSCTVVVDDDGPRPRPRPGSEPVMCTMEYDPVCGRRDGVQRTFSNACSARASGFRVVRPGECRRRGDDDGDFGDRPRACTREWRPVCARRGDHVRTFGNACTARADGYRIIAPGEC